MTRMFAAAYVPRGMWLAGGEVVKEWCAGSGFLSGNSGSLEKGGGRKGKGKMIREPRCLLME